MSISKVHTAAISMHNSKLALLATAGTLQTGSQYASRTCGVVVHVRCNVAGAVPFDKQQQVQVALYTPSA